MIKIFNNYAFYVICISIIAHLKHFIGICHFSWSWKETLIGWALLSNQKTSEKLNQ